MNRSDPDRGTGREDPDRGTGPEGHAGRRWPARVYGQGAEPDPRFSLANERTFLAWIRTSLALVASAAAVAALDLAMPLWLQDVLAVVLAAAGVAAAFQSWRGWARTELAMRGGRPLPSTPITLAVAVMVALVGVAVAVVAALGR